MRGVHERLQLGLAGYVEQWRARQWARRLEQLKASNDALAGSLQVSSQSCSSCCLHPVQLCKAPAELKPALQLSQT